MRIVFFILLQFLCFTVSSQEKVSEVVVTKNIGEWEIRNGYILKNDTNHNKLASQIWNAFYDIFPQEVTKKYIRRLVLITDGENEKTGALGPLDFDNKEWELVIDTTDVNFRTKDKERLKQSIYTIVHEFGHLVTLNNSQVRPTDKEFQESLGPYITDEGESYKQSYINIFVTRFWNGTLLDEWDYIQKKYCHTEASCVKKLYGLYMANSDDFVTDYAAESPEEDIAESWTAFVLNNRVKKVKTIYQKKTNFFYRFPELVKYRGSIKRNIKKYLYARK